MKKLMTLILTILLASSLYAQDRTLFNQGLSGGFGGPIFTLNQFGNDMVFGAGGGGGAMIGDFFIGGFGAGVESYGATFNEESYDYDLDFGGLWLGYSFFDEKVIHPYTSLQIGGGSVESRLADFETNLGEEYSVFVVRPVAGFEVNLAQWFKVVIAGGYHWTNGISGGAQLSDEQLSGATLSATLRFGFFR